jgi:hypothetical protein
LTKKFFVVIYPFVGGGKMKVIKSGACLVASLFLVAGVYAADNPRAAAPDTLKPYVWDFGRIKEGEVAKHNFILKNVSREVINLKEVTTSCGCATSKLKKTALGPGEATEVEISFNSRGFSGAVEKYVYVKTDNREAGKHLYIDGRINKAPQATEAPLPAGGIDNSILRLIIKGEVVRESKK